MDVELEYDKDIDTVNMEMYSRYDFTNNADKIYRCVLCKKPVCLGDSYSKRGNKLICNECGAPYFHGSATQYLRWANK